MTDYKRMYYSMFNEVTDVIERLKLAQQHCEDVYVQSEGTTLHFEESDQSNDT